MNLVITIKMKKGTTKYEARVTGEILASEILKRARTKYTIRNLFNQIIGNRLPKVEVTDDQEPNPMLYMYTHSEDIGQALQQIGGEPDEGYWIFNADPTGQSDDTQLTFYLNAPKEA